MEINIIYMDNNHKLSLWNWLLYTDPTHYKNKIVSSKKYKVA